LNNNIIAFLPVRKGSQRVKYKNIRDFSGIKGGLTYIKLSQLLKVERINTIIVSTNDKEVKKIADSFKSSKIIIDNRPEYLANSNTSTDKLINYVPSIINNGVVLWTHVTSPFINETTYSEAIKNYFHNDKNDSLMSVTKIQKFIWNKSEPISYNRNKEKWPQTQTIEPIYEVNSGIFLADINIYQDKKDRIGENPFFYELNTKVAFDIDWEDDFEIAELMWKKLNE